MNEKNLRFIISVIESNGDIFMYAPGECHGHIFMDGQSYSQSILRQRQGPDEKYVRHILELYKGQGIRFVRDGGDCLGVSLLAKSIACEYDIDYRTPAFAIYKKGHYGSIVGEAFTDRKSYVKAVEKAIRFGCDFIKIMVSGILSYDSYGQVSCLPLQEEEVSWMIAEAHERMCAVMVHANGDETCRACILAGADSIEHGFLMSKETLDILSESGTVWVPTLSPAYEAGKKSRYRKEVLDQINGEQKKKISYAQKQGACIAAGSDAGANGVYHGRAINTEVQLLEECGVKLEDILQSEKVIRQKFCKENSNHC